MGLKVFNTLSRSVEECVPLDPAGRKVSMYCCGPTIHDFAHIGNFRTFVTSDLVRRYLEFRGYEVRHVMNVPDVEDKIIARVRDSKTTLKDYTAKYEQAFFEDLRTLNCVSAHFYPHATEHIAEIIELIARLLERGLAYKTADGSVYFSIQKYQDTGHKYGQLVTLDFEQMRPGERVSADEYEKESIADFVLWKARALEDGAVSWPAPWGEGRPGWHIECSAMSMKILGPSFDLHLGGEDLMFPHHEDEIAQSEGAALHSHGGRFVKYWMHGAHLLVEGKKMSKSLGNFFTLRDLLNKGFSGREIRYLLLTAHYRESFNFTLDGLMAARTALARIDECLAKLTEAAGSSSANAQPSESNLDATLVERFTQTLDEDLNVSGAWGIIFEWVRETNRKLAEGTLNSTLAAVALATWAHLDKVLGIGTASKTEAPPELLALLDDRQAARKAKDFKRADAIRDELKTKGWVIEDTPKGPRLKRVS